MVLLGRGGSFKKWGPVGGLDIWSPWKGYCDQNSSSSLSLCHQGEQFCLISSARCSCHHVAPKQRSQATMDWNFQTMSQNKPFLFSVSGILLQQWKADLYKGKYMWRFTEATLDWLKQHHTATTGLWSWLASEPRVHVLALRLWAVLTSCECQFLTLQRHFHHEAVCWNRETNHRTCWVQSILQKSWPFALYPPQPCCRAQPAIPPWPRLASTVPSPTSTDLENTKLLSLS
jgi:hypothetical protein